MDNLETTSPARSAGDWQQQCDALQRQVTILLIGAVILSGTLSVFFWFQSRFAYADLETTKANVGPALQYFNQQEKPLYNRLEGQLADYARTHPDFAQLLATYRIQLVVSSTAPATPATNPTPAPAKPAPAAPPKK
jgi:hypothetical protein